VGSRHVSIHAGEDQVNRGLVVDLAAGEKSEDGDDAWRLPQTHYGFQSNKNKATELKAAAPPQKGHRAVAGDHKRRRRTPANDEKVRQTLLCCKKRLWRCEPLP
jgi:hypothetical protein